MVWCTSSISSLENYQMLLNHKKFMFTPLCSVLSTKPRLNSCCPSVGDCCTMILTDWCSRLCHDITDISTAIQIFLWLSSRRWWPLAGWLQPWGGSPLSGLSSSWLLQSRQGALQRSVKPNSSRSLTSPSEFLELTNNLAGEEDDDEEEFENGFFFPQPPSPNLLTEAPTPEFLGKRVYSNKNKWPKLQSNFVLIEFSPWNINIKIWQYIYLLTWNFPLRSFGKIIQFVHHSISFRIS